MDGSDLPTIAYTTSFNADLDPEIEKNLRAISLLTRLENRPPGSTTALKQRARNDLKHIKQAMSSLGYFDAKVSYRLNRTALPRSVVLTVIPGQRYTISAVSIVINEAGSTSYNITPSQARQALLLDIGENADLTKISDSAQKLRLFFMQRGFAFAKTNDPEGQIDRDGKKLHVTFTIIPGSLTQFGSSKIEGTQKVNEKFVRNRLIWQEGEIFDERKIEKTRKKLVQSGLFSAVSLKTGEEADKNHHVPVDLVVVEAPFRTLGAGLKYSSYDRTSGSVFWSHNNVFGGGEYFGVSAEHSVRLSTAKLNFNIPDFISAEQKLLTEVKATKEKTNAFLNKTRSCGFLIERSFLDIIIGSVGINGEIGKVTQEVRKYKNRLVSFPMEFKLDASNDILNPTQGGRLKIKVEPYKGKIGLKRSMMITRLGGTYYLPFLEKDRGILATWGTLGKIHVDDIKDVSPNKRLYSGGGGSIRGYGFQLLGPVDSNKVPTGGRSLFECGVEGRFKITDTIGMVTFIEGGSVSEKASPEINKKSLLWGAGFGVRYFTSIGPIRFDIAVPLKKRRTPSGRRIDSRYQIYASVGQAF